MSQARTVFGIPLTGHRETDTPPTDMHACVFLCVCWENRLCDCLLVSKFGCVQQRFKKKKKEQACIKRKCLTLLADKDQCWNFQTLGPGEVGKTEWEAYHHHAVFDSIAYMCCKQASMQQIFPHWFPLLHKLVLPAAQIIFFLIHLSFGLIWQQVWTNCTGVV